MSTVPQSESTLKAKLNAHLSWANTPNRSKRTQPARDAMMLKFEHEVDPDGVLSEIERALAAESARKAYFTGLALKSAQSRRKAKEAAAAAIAAEAELDEFNAGGAA